MTFVPWKMGTFSGFKGGGESRPQGLLERVSCPWLQAGLSLGRGHPLSELGKWAKFAKKVSHLCRRSWGRLEAPLDILPAGVQGALWAALAPSGEGVPRTRPESPQSLAGPPPPPWDPPPRVRSRQPSPPLGSTHLLTLGPQGGLFPGQASVSRAGQAGP